MRASAEQISNYWLWLKERGLRFVPEAKRGVLDVVFAVDGILTAEERALLDKMIASMQLAAGHLVVEDAATLQAQLKNQGARLVIGLGSGAGATLAPAQAFGDVRGKILDSEAFNCPLLLTLHPRDLLRNPADKRLVWTDLKVAMSALAGA